MSAVIEPEVMSQLPGCTVEVYETREQWLAARGIGGSSSPSILGVGYADHSPLSEWGRMVGQISPTEDTQRLRIGRKLEPLILELFAEETGFQVQTLGQFALCRSNKYPWLTYSTDGLVIDTPEGLAIAEAKNVGVFMARDWDDDDQPLKFQVQTNHGMEVAGVNIAYTIGLIGGNSLKWVKSYRNQKFIDVMLPKLAAFNDLVQSRTEPGPEWLDGSAGTKKALEKLHKLDNGETIVLPLESADWHEQLGDVKKRIKDLEPIEARLENTLRQAIGDASYGLLPDGSRYSWKHQSKIYCGFSSKNPHEEKETTFRVLRKCK